MNISADLQFHPYLNKNYSLFDILQKMEEKKINCLGFLYYLWEKETSNDLISQVEGKVKYEYDIDRLEENVFRFINKENNKMLFIILGQEVGAENQKWHILSIGVQEIKSTFVEGIIQEVLRRGGIPIIDHPFADPQRRFKDIDENKEREITTLCLKYRNEIALEWNSYSLPSIRRFLPGCSDTNKKTERLSKEIGIPLIPTTDLHAKSRYLLNEIGTSFIEIEVKNQNFLSSLKENILSLNFEAYKKYVSKKHFLLAYKSEIFRKEIR